MKKYNSYHEIIEGITQKASEEEIERIKKEDDLFNKRGWTKYILALVNFLNDAFPRDYIGNFSLGGSVADSYIIYKATESNSILIGDPLKQRSSAILFNDALRIICQTHTDFVSEDEINNLIKKLTKQLDSNKLYYKSAFMPNVFHGNYGRSRKFAKVLIVSTSVVSDECINVVRSEKQVNETEENKEILRGLLLFYFPRISGL